MWLTRKDCISINLKKVKRIYTFDNDIKESFDIIFDDGGNSYNYYFTDKKKRDKYHETVMKQLKTFTINESDPITL